MYPTLAREAVRFFGPLLFMWFGSEAVEKSAEAIGENVTQPTTQLLGVNPDGSEDWRVNIVSLGLMGMVVAYAYGRIFGKDV